MSSLSQTASPVYSTQHLPSSNTRTVIGWPSNHLARSMSMPRIRISARAPLTFRAAKPVGPNHHATAFALCISAANRAELMMSAAVMPRAVAMASRSSVEKALRNRKRS